MSEESEEFLSSNYKINSKSSSVEDSLTAKLDNMLHSSDEIIVENADFFKPSSNEMTEIEDVGDLPPDNRSVPRLDLDDQGRNKYKSSESYTSLGTVVRHETPKIGQRRIKVLHASRPQSAKNRSNSYRPKEKINNKEFMSCLNKITLKNPGLSRIIKADRKEFEKYFYFKVKEFRNILDENESNVKLIQAVIIKKEQVRIKNKEKERKTEEIKNKLEEEELERMRISNIKYEENCNTLLKNIVENTLNKLKNLKKIEESKEAKELEKHRNNQKQVIIENIKKIYDDRISMFKEKMVERKNHKKIFEHEHIVVFAQAERSRKEERKLIHENKKNQLKKEFEYTDLVTKSKAESVFNLILKKYKKSPGIKR